MHMGGQPYIRHSIKIRFDPALIIAIRHRTHKLTHGPICCSTWIQQVNAKCRPSRRTPLMATMSHGGVHGIQPALSDRSLWSGLQEEGLATSDWLTNESMTVDACVAHLMSHSRRMMTLSSGSTEGCVPSDSSKITGTH